MVPRLVSFPAGKVEPPGNFGPITRLSLRSFIKVMPMRPFSLHAHCHSLCGD